MTLTGELIEVVPVLLIFVKICPWVVRVPGLVVAMLVVAKLRILIGAYFVVVELFTM